MKTVKLKNIFNGEIVFCEDLNNITEANGNKFITVFKEEHSQRTFLVNKEAFEIVTDTP